MKQESFEMLPGVVVAPERALLYSMSSEGGVEGIDARTGERRWATDLATRPLLVRSGKLLAQRATGAGEHVLRLVYLPLAKEGPVSAAVDLPLPPGIVPVVDETATQTFRVRAQAQNGSVLVSWEYVERHVKGSLPANAGLPTVKNTEGCARIEDDGGEVPRLVPVASCPRPEPAKIPEPVLVLARKGDLSTPPERFDDSVFATAETESEPPRVELRRWSTETSAALASVPLGEGHPVAQLASPDGRHLLVSIREPATEASRRIFRWAVVDTATGKLATEIRRPGSAAPFCVLGGRLITVEQPSGRQIDGKWTSRPLRLVALDVGTGQEVWSRPVRDTSYRGEAPPSLEVGR